MLYNRARMKDKLPKAKVWTEKEIGKITPDVANKILRGVATGTTMVSPGLLDNLLNVSQKNNQGIRPR